MGSKKRWLILTSIANGTKDQGLFKYVREREKDGESLLTNVLEDVDDEERRDQVVDALHVAAGRVSDGPDKQNPLKNLFTRT